MTSKARQLADLGGDTANLETLAAGPTTDIVAVGNAYSDGALSNRNLIINGAMQVAQRGTSSTSAGYQTVDRFRADIDQGTTTLSHEALTSGDPYDAGFRNFFRMTNTVAGSSTSTRRKFYQPIEAQNVANSGWNYTSTGSYITVSFWVRSSIAGDYYFSFQTRDGTNYGYAFKETLAANTWTKVVKSVAGNSNLVIDNNTGDGFRLNFNPYHGTDWTGGSSLDEWAVYNNNQRYPDDTNGWGTTTGATYDVTGVQLEVGDTATPFEHRSYGQELALCQRYYYKTQDGFYSMHFVRSYNNSNEYFGLFQLPVPMRADPSISFESNSIRLPNIADTTGTLSMYASGTHAQTLKCVPSSDYGAYTYTAMARSGLRADAEL